MRFIYLSIFLLFQSALIAQRDTLSDLKIGAWQQHLPWKSARYVTSSDSKIYCATQWAVVEIDKSDNSPNFLSKVSGLSDIGMGVIRFNKNANVLLLTYSNSNIDLWRPDGSVTNMPFIKKNVALSGDKRIYDVFIDDKFAYLACGFGVVKLNLEQEEVEFTVFTGIPVKSFAIFQNNLCAATEEGIYSLDASNQNPADFSQWQLLGQAEGFPADYGVQAMAVFNEKLYIGSKKELYEYNGATLQVVGTDANLDVIYLSTEGEGLVIGWKEQYTGKVIYREKSGAQYEIQATCDAIRPLYAIEDGSKKFWFADDDNDFRNFDANSNQCNRLKFNSPNSVSTTEISIQNDVVHIATPGPPSQLNPTYGREGVYVYKNKQWSQFSIATNPELQSGDCYADMWRVEADPNSDRYFVGSWVGGLIEKKGDEVKCYSKNNSILQNAGASGSDRTAIGGMAFDNQKNLWISNYDAIAPIAVLKEDGTFSNFANAPANNLLQVTIDQNGYKWFVVAFNGGVLVYDSGAKLTDPSDDQYRLITTSNSVLPSNAVSCITVDLEGNVWVGTQQGTVSFECGANIFDAECKGSRRIVEVDGFNGYLLETEDVRAIAIDGGNRKWFGTSNGIFLQTPNGDEQVTKYTSTNSPLFDNAINDIQINPRNGEVWIATEKGIQTLRTEAVNGTKINLPTAYAYPNPVRPDYQGLISIYGLARDANVKITDAAGSLVYEGKSLGGQAVWDGRDYTGKRAASGVYLIFATSSETFENPDAIVTKVVILN
jgi:ligand-binding sensor domain-containing protein